MMNCRSRRDSSSICLQPPGSICLEHPRSLTRTLSCNRQASLWTWTRGKSRESRESRESGESGKSGESGESGGPRVSVRITIPTPEQFSFQRTVMSHGWCELPPFELDRSNWQLTRVIETGPARAVTVAISDGAGSLKVDVHGRVANKALMKIEREVRHMMRLDDDLADFYNAM